MTTSAHAPALQNRARTMRFNRSYSTGKEKDSETGYYAFGARYYDCDLSGIFLSVDPMSDKYPNISPYAYCAWNPVKLVDPDGNDIWELNKNGELIWKESSDKDIIKTRNGRSVTVAEGVLKREKGQSYTKADGHLQLNFGNNSNNATEVFEFLADNSDVEFSLLGLVSAENEHQTEADGYLITSSFNEEGDSWGSFIACTQSEENRMRSHTHSHPNGYLGPSSSFNNGILLVPYAGIQIGDDQGFASYVKKGSPMCTFNIYVSSKGGQYRPYEIQHNGGIPDYKYVPSMVNKKGGHYVIP